MALQKITKHVLHDNIISGQSTVTAATNDFVLIQDVSDSNTLKKALISDFGVAGISSSADATAITIDSGESVTFSQNAVVAGDLTVDTNTLHVDSADNRVGIGTTSPVSMLSMDSDHWNTGTEDTYSIRWNNTITTADSVLQSFEDSNVVPLIMGTNAYIASGGSFSSFNSSYPSAYVYTAADGSIYLGNAASGNPSNKIRLNPTGEVGIGTSASTHYTGYEALDIGQTLSLFSNNTGTNVSTLTNNGYLNSNASNWVYKVDDEATMYSQVHGDHRFSTAASGSAGGAITWLEKMRIDSDGDVSIGVSGDAAGGSKLHVKGNAIFLEDSPISTSNTNASPDMDNSSTGGLHFYSSASSTTEGLTFSTPSHGTQAGIVCHNNNSDGTHLGFFTTNSYASGPQCRWKMTNYGTLLGAVNTHVKTTTANTKNAIQVEAGDIEVTAANNNLAISDLLAGYTRGDYAAITSSANHVYFNVGSSYVGYINGSSGAYTVSDERLKTNIQTLTGTLDKVKQLRGVTHTWKDTENKGTDTVIGMIAQEVEKIYPELVGDGGLPNDNEGNAPYKSVNYAHLTSILVEAVKELSAKNDALEDRIKTLEG